MGIRLTKEVKRLLKNDELMAHGENVVKTRKRNRPDLDKFGEEHTEPGDNARYLRFAMVSLDLPPRDISYRPQVKHSIHHEFLYIEDKSRINNMKGLGNWLGVDKTTVNSWKRGEYRSSTHSPLIQKAVDILEELWIDYMQNGKVNPGSGIFLGKNLFGYRDVIDIAPTTAPPLGDSPDQKQLEERIAGSVVVDE